MATYLTKKEKEIEGHLKTKTIKFGTKGYISTKAVTKEIIEVEPTKKEKKVEYITIKPKKATDLITKKEYPIIGKDY